MLIHSLSYLFYRPFFVLSFFLGLSFVSPCCLWASDVQGEHNKATEQIELGQQIYRQGRLASGEAVEAYVMGDMKVLGTQFACLNCHGRSGMGGAEGKTFTLAINPAALFTPRKGVYLERPAYTDETFAKVLRSGKVPGDKTLSAAMPVYQLPDREMAALTAYIKTLSSTFSPGVSEETIHFATVISDEIKPGAARSMLSVLERFFQDKNSRTRYENKRQKYGPFYQHYRIKAYRDWALHVFRLHGPRESWQRQLADYYRQQPVFAMVSGMVAGSWEPVHQFCEQNEIPCLLPNTDFPAAPGKSDFYTMYFSEGLGLEAKVIARSVAASGKEANILQVFSSRSGGSSGASSLRSILKQQGDAVTDWKLSNHEQFTWKELDHRVHGSAADAVVLWLTSRDLANAGPAVEREKFTGPLYLSSSLLGGFFVDFPEVSGRMAKVAHPFNPPEKQELIYKRLKVWLDSRGLKSEHRRIIGQSYYACMILGKGLAHIKNHFYRDYFLDALDHGNAKSIFSINYPRLSYGPGQRYLAKGAYIVEGTLQRDQISTLVSTWIVPDL
ncbi:MAG: hypothetical protein DSY58_01850 [Desulfobulbus sp.]|nr:MAG: hypothetical protein DSY58_01850 [Desulfobulbus sp.]